MSYFLLPVLAGGGQNQVGNDFGISASVKMIATLLEFIAEQFGVDDIAIMCVNPSDFTIMGWAFVGLLEPVVE
jgi:hypothetical protein